MLRVRQIGPLRPHTPKDEDRLCSFGDQVDGEETYRCQAQPRGRRPAPAQARRDRGVLGKTRRIPRADLSRLEPTGGASGVSQASLVSGAEFGAPAPRAGQRPHFAKCGRPASARHSPLPCFPSVHPSPLAYPATANCIPARQTHESPPHPSRQFPLWRSRLAVRGEPPERRRPPATFLLADA